MDKSKNVKYTSEQKQWSSLADQVNALNAKKKNAWVSSVRVQIRRILYVTDLIKVKYCSHFKGYNSSIDSRNTTVVNMSSERSIHEHEV